MYNKKHEHNHFSARPSMGRVIALLALILGVSALLLGLSANGVLAGAPTPATNSPHLTSPMPAQPLETLLNKDGTLNLASGFTGSLDPTGFRMSADPNEPPRFVKTGDQQAAPQPRSAASSPMSPGDENWMSGSMRQVLKAKYGQLRSLARICTSAGYSPRQVGC